MISHDVLRLRIAFALVADAVSRLFNYARIIFFLSLVAGLVIAAWRTDHLHNGIWILDATALGVITSKLIRWIGIEL
jgi:hypothetical protein